MVLRNVRLPGMEGLYQLQTDARGQISSIQSSAAGTNLLATNTAKTVDFSGDWLSLGGVDLQINGALGIAFPDLGQYPVERLQEICQFLWQQGVNAFLPTLVTTSVEKIHRALAAIATVMQSQASQASGQSQLQPEPTARILGVHLEGPFLNPEKRGAHPAAHLLPLNVETVEQVLGRWTHIVKLITLAPELDQTGNAIAMLRDRSIAVSLGHSQATANQAQQAFKQGAALVTHAFNAMPAIHHRRPGLLGAAMLDPHVYCGLIADGEHVDPIAIALLLRASCGPCDPSASSSLPRVFLVSDALAPLGLSDGRYPWDCREIEVKSGTARLLDGTLSGTTLPLLAGVTNLVQWDICEPETAIAMATLTPRLALGEFPATPKPHELDEEWLKSIYLGQPLNTMLRWRWHNHSLGWQRVFPSPTLK